MTKNNNGLLPDKLESESCEANQSDIEDEENDKIDSLSDSRAKKYAIKKLKSRNADGSEDTVSALEKQDVDDVSTFTKESSENKADDYKKPNSSKEPQKAQEKQTNTEIAWKRNFLIFSIIVIPIIATFACKFLYLSVIPDISQDHSFIKPEEFDFKIAKMNQKFKNQDKMFWRQIRTRGFIHLKRAFNQSRKTVVPSTIFIAGYNGTNSTMNCFLKELGHSFTNKSYETLYSEGISKESLDEKINQSLSKLQKYVVVRDIHKMSYDAASLFMAYADEHMDNSAVSFPLSVIIMTAEMPFSSDDPYDRKADEIKVRKHFVSNLWGEDENKNAALWSRIGNLVVLLKPESLTDRCDQIV